jgi:CRISPR/Cas system CSM-associated protein Csm4 (group 5 of RAMP superfamily)
VLVATKKKKKLRFVQVKVFSKLKHEKNDTEEQVTQKRKWNTKKKGSSPEFSAFSIIFISYPHYTAEFTSIFSSHIHQILHKPENIGECNQTPWSRTSRCNIHQAKPNYKNWV